jgi:phosphatidylglycerophosphatase A
VMNFKGKMIFFFSTCGYIGKIPLAPGTFGSVVGLVVCFLLSRISISLSALIAIALILSAIWLSEHAERIIGEKDPGCIVIDEVAGMVVTMIGLPFNALMAISGFILFRLTDIIKPPPVRMIQDNLSGGGGVVMDDVAAGIIVNLLLRFMCLVMGI